ncbi:MAG: PqqD family protein [Candidatus Krumholzibacteria bacterium]|nr:PqqD family protein [Candidatus Krumholzibacteria bacterium]
MQWPWRRRRFQNTDYLDLVPARKVESEPGSDPARLLLLLPRFRDPILGRILQPRLRQHRRFIRVPLDPRGSWLWTQVDGERTVGELARGFRAAFPADVEHVEVRICHYVAALESHGLLTLRSSVRYPAIAQIP